MDRKDVTVIVIPHGKEYVREFRFSRRFLRMVLCFFAMLLASSVFYGTQYHLRAKQHSRLKSSERENKALREQLQSIQHKARVLKEKMDKLAERSDALRVIAELPEIDADTRMVGVGGPPFEDDRTYADFNSSSRNMLEKTEAEIDRLLRQAALEKASFQQIEQKLVADKQLRDHTPSILPTYGYISSPFGYRTDPLTGRRMFHKGIDIACRLGTPIYATANGEVIYAKYSKGYGNALMIDHGRGVRTLYAHLSKMSVGRGAKVVRGQKVGEMGKTGRTSGCHLHYEVSRGGRAVNPWYYFYTKEEID